MRYALHTYGRHINEYSCNLLPTVCLTDQYMTEPATKRQRLDLNARRIEAIGNQQAYVALFNQCLGACQRIRVNGHDTYTVTHDEGNTYCTSVDTGCVYQLCLSTDAYAGAFHAHAYMNPSGPRGFGSIWFDDDEFWIFGDEYKYLDTSVNLDAFRWNFYDAYKKSFDRVLATCAVAKIIGPSEEILYTVQIVRDDDKTSLCHGETKESLETSKLFHFQDLHMWTRYMDSSRLSKWPNAVAIMLDDREWKLGNEWCLHSYVRAHYDVYEVEAGTKLCHRQKQGAYSAEPYAPQPDADASAPFEIDPSRPFFCALYPEDKAVCSNATLGYAGTLRVFDAPRKLRLLTRGRDCARDAYVGQHTIECPLHSDYQSVEETLERICKYRGFDGWRAICVSDQGVCDDTFFVWFENYIDENTLNQLVMRADPFMKHMFAWWPLVKENIHSVDSDENCTLIWVGLDSSIPTPMDVYQHIVRSLGGMRAVNTLLALRDGNFEICIIPHT